MYSVSGAYLSAVRTSTMQWAVCEAWRGGVKLQTTTPLDIDSGSVTDNSAPGVRRQLDLGLLPKAGLFDLLSPIGTELRVRSIIRYPSGVTESLPMGVFDIDSASIGYGPAGTITVRASDKWAKIQRAKFLLPKTSWTGLRITAQITALIREVLGASEPVNVLTSDTTTVGTLVWEGDRDKAIIELAESIGCWVYFDRDGIATIAPLPTGSPGAAVWSVDAGASGVLLDASRSRDRSNTFNVVVVAGQKADGIPPFDPQIVWDNDPSSPTYAGTDPLNGTSAGPFGIVPYPFTSPIVEHLGQAQIAGLAKLTQLRGLNAQLTLSSVRNHALDVLDSISVTLPADSYGASPVVERHLVDKITHPLTSEGATSIETRSTNTNAP